MFDDLREQIINIFTNRLTLLYLAIIALGSVLVMRCFNLQIVNGQDYLDNFVLEQEKTRDIYAPRGNIYDRNGNLLAYNELAYSVKIEDTFESGADKNEKLNSEILTLIRLIKKNGGSIDSNFNIYIDENNHFQFSVSGKHLTRFLADVYDHIYMSDLTEDEAESSALDVMKYLSRASGRGFHYGIGDYVDPDNADSFIAGRGLTKQEWLNTVSIRYAMSLTSYRKYIGTTVATDVDDKTVAVILENSDILPGVSIEEDTIRRYVDSVYFSHLLGYTGKVSSEELELLNENSATNEDGFVYTMNDVVGKNGIENYYESYLQGTKGYEKVMVNNTGKVITVLDKEEPVAGNDVYLSIDKDLTIACYNILEQQIAGLVAEKIINAKEYKLPENSSSSNIKIPIYDVYFATINNSIVDINHFSDENAGENEKAVYEAYLLYKDATYNKLREELYENLTPYKKLKQEYKVYETNIIQLMIKEKLILMDKVDTEDQTYIDWAVDEVISMAEYLRYCIRMNWIDTNKLEIDSKYADSDQIFDAFVNKMFQCLDENKDFQKRFYKYMLLNDKISPKQICMIMYEQDVCNMPETEIDALKAGRMTPYQFMYNRVANIDITPAQLALDPCNGSMVITDVNNGQVLALVTYPGYDNNKMANSVDPVYYDKLLNDKSSPILNYATQYKAAPGSTFKMVVASAGLMEGVIDKNTIIDCSVWYNKVTPPPRCLSTYGHGFENVINALRDSCNYYFFETGFRLACADGSYNDVTGIDTLLNYVDMYGLTEKSGIEIEEYEPNIPTTDVVRSCIGQGTNSYTNIGLARYVTAIANRGTVYNLSLFDHINDSYGTEILSYEPSVRNEIDMPDKYWDLIQSGMRSSIIGRSYFEIPVKVAGKTGTAEQTRTRPSHALFVCYAPYEKPEIAVSTRIMFGYVSGYAAKATSSAIQYYYHLTDDEDILNGSAALNNGTVENTLE